MDSSNHLDEVVESLIGIKYFIETHVQKFQSKRCSPDELLVCLETIISEAERARKLLLSDEDPSDDNDSEAPS